MKHEIVYIDDYALIVSDEQIEDVRPFIGRYHLEKGNMIYQFPTYLTDLTYCKLIIAHRPLTDAPILEGVPLLPGFSQDNDVEDLAKDVYPYLGPERVKSEQNRHTDILRYGFKAGYNKAKETYKYTEDDLIAVWNVAFEEGVSLDDEINDPVSFKDVIQSLQQPKHFQNELDVNCTGNNNNGCFLDSAGHNCGCVSIKTIINSQGQTELVGSYIY
jgi:hypothetical protein